MNNRSGILADGRLRPHFWNQHLAFKGYTLHLAVSRDASLDRPRTTPMVHNRLAAYRVERGWSRQQLADQLDIRLSTLDALESQLYTPSLPLALRISAFFAVPVEQLFTIPDDQLELSNR